MLSSSPLHTKQQDLVHTAYCSPVTGEKGKTLGNLCIAPHMHFSLLIISFGLLDFKSIIWTNKKNSTLYTWGVPFPPLHFTVKNIGKTPLLSQRAWFCPIHPQALSLRAGAGRGTLMPSNLLTGKQRGGSWANLKPCLNLSSLRMLMSLPWILPWNELF